MSKARVVRNDEGEVEEGADWVFKAAAGNTDGMFDFMVGPVEYLSGPPLHVHREQHDSFYVLEGTLTVQIDEEVVELSSGDFVTIPPGTPHTFDNLDDGGTVRAINVMTPGGLGELFSELAVVGTTEDPAEAARDAAQRHGVTRVGPPLREKLGLG